MWKCFRKKVPQKNTKMFFEKMPLLVFQKILEKMSYEDRYNFIRAIQENENLVRSYQQITYRGLNEIPKNQMVCSICLDSQTDNFLMENFKIGPYFTYKEPVTIIDVNEGRITFDEYLDISYDSWQSHQLTKKRLSAFAPKVTKITFSESTPKKVRFERDLDFVKDQEQAFGIFKLENFEKNSAASLCPIQQDALQAYHDFCSRNDLKEKLVSSFKEMPIFQGPRDLLEHLETEHQDLAVAGRSFRIRKILREMIKWKPVVSDFAQVRRDHVSTGKVYDFDSTMTFFGLRDRIENDTYCILLQDLFLHGPKRYPCNSSDRKLLAIRDYLLNFGSVMSNYHYRADNFYQFEVRQDHIHLGVLNTLRGLMNGKFFDRFPY